MFYIYSFSPNTLLTSEDVKGVRAKESFEAISLLKKMPCGLPQRVSFSFILAVGKLYGLKWL